MYRFKCIRGPEIVAFLYGLLFALSSRIVSLHNFQCTYYLIISNLFPRTITFFEYVLICSFCPWNLPFSLCWNFCLLLSLMTSLVFWIFSGFTSSFHWNISFCGFPRRVTREVNLLKTWELHVYECIYSTLTVQHRILSWKSFSFNDLKHTPLSCFWWSCWRKHWLFSL